MASLLTLVRSRPLLNLGAGEVLIEAGESAGELYVLESGRLSVEREGVAIAHIAEPGALIGEISVLLGIDHSATVRAESAAAVRVVEDALAFMERTPLVAIAVATLACERLNATSALLARLKNEAAGRSGEQRLLGRIFSALVEPPPRSGWRAHE